MELHRAQRWASSLHTSPTAFRGEEEALVSSFTRRRPRPKRSSHPSNKAQASLGWGCPGEDGTANFSRERNIGRELNLWGASVSPHSRACLTHLVAGLSKKMCVGRLPGPFGLYDSLVLALIEEGCLRLGGQKKLQGQKFHLRRQSHNSPRDHLSAFICFPNTEKHCLIGFTFSSIWYFISLWLGPLRYSKRGRL